MRFEQLETGDQIETDNNSFVKINNYNEFLQFDNKGKIEQILIKEKKIKEIAKKSKILFYWINTKNGFIKFVIKNHTKQDGIYEGFLKYKKIQEEKRG